MSKYDIKDAIMLKECMKQIALIRAKYPNGPAYYLDVGDDLKLAIEFIQEMVEKKV